MQELYINPNWNFKQAIYNLKTLKAQYEVVLASFYYFDLKDAVNFKRKTRNCFYSLDLQEWEKDKLWNYMNGFEKLEVLEKIVERRK